MRKFSSHLFRLFIYHQIRVISWCVDVGNTSARRREQPTTSTMYF